MNNKFQPVTDDTDVNFIYAICLKEGETNGKLGRLTVVDSISKISPEDIWIIRLMC